MSERQWRPGEPAPTNRRPAMDGSQHAPPPGLPPLPPLPPPMPEIPDHTHPWPSTLGEARRRPFTRGRLGQRQPPSDRAPRDAASPTRSRPARPRADGHSRGKRTLGDAPQVPTRQLPAPTTRGALIRGEHPSSQLTRTPNASQRIPATIPRPSAPAERHKGRTLVTSAAILLTAVVSIAFGAVHALGSETPPPATRADLSTGALAQATATGTPPPSGSVPKGVWVASAGSVVFVPPPPKPSPNTGGPGLISSIQPCHDTVMFVAHITQWTVPPGCYANIYVPNAANYPARPTFGYCNWWVRENHLSNYNITMGSQVLMGTTPKPGYAAWFDGGVQGASAEGHWTQVVAVAPDGYWFLIGEMNFGWRGAGFGKIDYRYVHVGPGVRFYM
ncbi:MAG TPA: hypothetical protein VFY89_10920 [Ktedonobacterales bacterium]